MAMGDWDKAEQGRAQTKQRERENSDLSLRHFKERPKVQFMLVLRLPRSLP